jgi:predicted transposase
MKLTVAVKLLPTHQQADALRETLQRSNSASNYVSEVAWEARVFSKHALQRLAYPEVKDRFELTAQATIQAIRKVADSYRLDKKSRRTYRKFGSIAYDDRILSWKPGASEVSIWTVANKHRQRMAFACGERHVRCSKAGAANLISSTGLVSFTCLLR